MRVKHGVGDESAAAFAVLRGYLEARASFTDEELQFIRTMFTPRRLSAGDFLQRAGAVAQYSAFVAKGCLRTYTIDSKGKERIVSSISASAHERYLQFLETYSSLATRVPQWMLASYLGVTPETVSRIRRKLARR